MKITECLDHFSEDLAGTSIAVPEKTTLFRTATSVLGMAQAYESDGRTFLASGDTVNALASFWYGLGWLHFGYTYGLLVTPGRSPCPFASPFETLPVAYRKRLVEKTERYDRLLNLARSSVVPASAAETAAYDVAERILCIADAYSRAGEWVMKEGRWEDALSCFSYGHGWLDAAVTSGLFRIVAEHDLFTV